MRNVELKARVDNLEQLLIRAGEMTGTDAVQIQQDDTFFVCANGRLKLRDFLDGTGELIFYRRADQAGPKLSFYVRSPTSSPATLRESLTLAYGQIGRVVKNRTLLMLGKTRLHFDRVTNLGDFFELEVVLDENETAEAGAREADRIRKCLGIAAGQLIDCAYIDLLTIPPVELPVVA